MTSTARAKLPTVPPKRTVSQVESNNPLDGKRVAVKKSAPTSAASGVETRAKIIRAALDCLATEGIAGTSTRAIARLGNFNQALVFYHFGSVEQLLIAASISESELRAQRYTERLAIVQSFPELVKVARQLHDEEVAEGSIAVLTQLLAAAASSPELQKGILDGLQPWMKLIEDAVERVIKDSPLAHALPASDLAFAIASLFIGVELMAGLDANREAERRLFATIEALGYLVDALLNMTMPAPQGSPGAAPSSTTA